MTHADEIAAVVATTKFCRDCRWSKPASSLLSWQCASPEIPTSQNPIDGSSKPLVSFCDIARERSVYCGPEARWFEPRQTKAEARRIEDEARHGDYDFALGKDGRFVE